MLDNFNVVEEACKLRSIRPWMPHPQGHGPPDTSSICLRPFSLSRLPVSALQAMPDLTEIILPASNKIEIGPECRVLHIQKVTAFACGLRPATLAGILSIPTVARLDLSGNILSSEHWSVLCTAADRLRELRVTHGMSDEALESIGTMKTLEVLSISLNTRVSVNVGSIVTDGLTVLVVRNTGLEINGLVAICQLKKLKRLDVGRNKTLGPGITADFDFGHVRETLTELMADEIDLTEAALEKIRHFRMLEVLSLGHNRIGKAFGDGYEFKNLRPTLRELNLNATGLEWDGLRAIGQQLEGIERLRASWNLGLATPMPSDFSFGNLVGTVLELNMWYIGFGQRGFEGLAQFRRMNLMTVKDVGSFGSAIVGDFDLGNLKDTLTEVRLFGSKLTPEGLMKLGELRALKTLSVEFNPELGVVSDLPSNAISLGCLENTLVEVDISASGMRYELLTAFCECRRLKNLRISYNEDLGPSLPADFDLKYLKDTLEELLVDSTNMGEAGLRAIAECRCLWILGLSGNEAVGEILASGFDLKYLKGTLRLLSLAACNLTPTGLKNVLKCGNLTTLNLRENEELGGSALADFEFEKSERMSSIQLNDCGVDEEIVNAIVDAFPIADVKY